MNLEHVVMLSMKHGPHCVWCRARQEWRRWARIRDAAGTAMVLILALGAVYLFATVLNSLLPPPGVGQ